MYFVTLKAATVFFPPLRFYIAMLYGTMAGHHWRLHINYGGTSTALASQ